MASTRTPPPLVIKGSFHNYTMQFAFQLGLRLIWLLPHNFLQVWWENNQLKQFQISSSTGLIDSVPPTPGDSNQMESNDLSVPSPMITPRRAINQVTLTNSISFSRKSNQLKKLKLNRKHLVDLIFQSQNNDVKSCALFIVKLLSDLCQSRSCVNFL